MPPMTMLDVSQLDPSLPAPPLMVPYRPNADQVGHGRIMPMVGGRRNYVLDVLNHERSHRIYADEPEDVFCHMVPGFADAYQKLAAADQLGDPLTIADAHADMLGVLHAWTADVRAAMQAQLNEEARASGAWERLTDEERHQLTGGAEGGIPFGVAVIREYPDPDGGLIEMETGIWETREVDLVIDRADYGLYSVEEYVEEPTSEVAVFDEVLGEEVIPVLKWPLNMRVLDSTSPQALFEALEHYGWISVTTYLPEVEDALYLDAVKVGRTIMEATGMDLSGWVGFDPDTAADGPSTRPRYDHSHDHDHSHPHGHSHPHDHSHDHGDGHTHDH